MAQFYMQGLHGVLNMSEYVQYAWLYLDVTQYVTQYV